LEEKNHFQLAKYTEEERRAMQESDAFFDFDNGADHSPLEEPHHQNGRQDVSQSPLHLQQQDMSNLASEVEKMKVNASHQPQVSDPAIINVMRFPPGQMPPFLPPGVHPMQFPPGILPQAGQFTGPPPPSGLSDPAIMSMGQLPPHLLLLQQQQQFQRQAAMMSQPPPQQPLHQGGARTVEDIERQLLADQKHQDERRHQQQQLLHQQQQQARFHQHQQQQQQMRHQYQQHQHQQFQNPHQQQRYNNNQGHNFGSPGNIALKNFGR
jgi:hypothetical protein